MTARQSLYFIQAPEIVLPEETGILPLLEDSEGFLSIVVDVQDIAYIDEAGD